VGISPRPLFQAHWFDSLLAFHFGKLRQWQRLVLHRLDLHDLLARLRVNPKLSAQLGSDEKAG
jgi:hypothetical protein